MNDHTSTSGLKLINAAELGRPAGHYSHAVRTRDTLYLSGLLPITPQGQKLVDASFDVQAQQVFNNLEAVLSAAGVTKNQLVQVRVYLTNIAQWPAFNQLYGDWLGAHYPARCIVPVPNLHYDLALEIEAIAQIVEN